MARPREPSTLLAQLSSCSRTWLSSSVPWKVPDNIGEMGAAWFRCHLKLHLCSERTVCVRYQSRKKRSPHGSIDYQSLDSSHAESLQPTNTRDSEWLSDHWGGDRFTNPFFSYIILGWGRDGLSCHQKIPVYTRIDSAFFLCRRYTSVSAQGCLTL